MPELLDFSFITDEGLRSSLDSDYAELQSCLASGAWKAVHVLSGSIVEALLVDYLNEAGGTGKSPLKMTFEELIAQSASLGVLTERTADLSSVVRSYRNLIHPGRVLRLKEPVTEQGARIADALVSLIVSEVAAQRAELYGLTAEQLLTKFEGDATALAIAEHLLRDTKPQQLERLLLKVLPERYFVLNGIEFLEDEELDAMTHLERLFIAAFDASPPEVQKKAAKRFVAVLREETGWRVAIHEERFFRGYFLEHLSESERKLVRDHLLPRLTGSLSQHLIACVEGLSAFLPVEQLGTLCDALIRTLSYSKDEAVRRAAVSRIESEYRHWVPTALEPRVIERLDAWIALHEAKERSISATRVTAVRNALAPDDDIPF